MDTNKPSEVPKFSFQSIGLPKLGDKDGLKSFVAD